MKKSSSQQLQARGYVDVSQIKTPAYFDEDKALKDLQHAQAVTRTGAAIIIGRFQPARLLPHLCQALKKETKLYTRLALGEAISQYSTDALPHLEPLIGHIGHNQHKKPVIVDINKSSYPLPRDMAVRIICRIGQAALPFLEDLLARTSEQIQSEVIDAIGHIAYTHHDERSLTVLLSLYHQTGNELIRWKLIRAFQAFSDPAVMTLLKKIKDRPHPVFRAEARRSLDRIGKDRSN